MAERVIREMVEKKKKLRACVVVWSVYVTDSRVRKYVETLDDLGFNVDVIAISPRKLDKWPNIYNIRNITVYEIAARRKESSKIDYIMTFIKFFALSTYYISRFQIHKKYNLVHVHTPPDFQVYAAWLPKLMGAKIILDIHDPMPDFFSAKFGSEGNTILVRILEIIERLSLKFADHGITVTNYWKTVICNRSKVPKKKMSVIVNLPDVNLFDADKYPRTRGTENFKLLYPGTVNKHCGLDVALKAVSLVREKIPSIKFEIYGKGSEFERIKAMRKELHLEREVSFHDHVALDQVPALMANADIGIALLAGNEKYSRQALNVKLLEFMAMGLPAIATRTAATQYYLNDQVVMFSKPNDPEDVARCILDLYCNPPLREALRKAGWEFTRKLNWNVKAVEFIKILDGLMAKEEKTLGIHRLISATRKN